LFSAPFISCGISQQVDAKVPVEDLFNQALAAEGQSYLVLRSNILAYGSSATAFLESKKATGDLHD